MAVFEGVYGTLEKLTKLEDLDVEQNPFWSEECRRDFVQLPITRLNGQLISKAEKESQVESSSSVLGMYSSGIVNPLNVSMVMNNSQTSFFNKNSRGGKRSKLKELKESLRRL